MKNRSNSGNVLLLVCILLVLVLIFILVVANQATKDVSRQASTGTLLQDVYEGIVGNPGKDTFGYLGDVGDYPASLMDLTTNPVGVSNWKGPYINTAPLAPFSNTMMMVDHYGSPLEYFVNFANGTTDQITVISRGRDHGSTNQAANPNIDSQFTAPLPTSGTYGTSNPDNEVYPDFVTSSNNLYRENAGTVSFAVQNFDQISTAGSSALVDGCPNLYGVNITSVPRGSNDTTNLAFPGATYANSLTAQLLQGLYDVEITSQFSRGSIWRERMAILPGFALSRNIYAPRIDSANVPSFNLTIYNNTNPGVSIAMARPGSVMGSVTTSGGNGPVKTFSVPGCSQLTATIPSGGTDNFIMPYGNYVRAIKQTPQITWNLTITNGGTNSDVIKVVHTGFQGTTGNGLVLATIYKRHTRTIAVPATQNATIPAGNQGVLIEIRKRDNTLIAPGTFSPVQTGLYSGNTTFTVP